MKKIIIILIGLVVGLTSSYFYFSPPETPGLLLGQQQTFSPDFNPLVDSKYWLGTSTPSTLAWRGLVVDEICLTADSCETSWGSGGSGGGVSTSTNPLMATYLVATSTTQSSILPNASTTNLSVSGYFDFLGTVINNVPTWFNGLFDTQLATKDTDDLTEGSSNLYNQTHTGEVTGATALTIADNIIEEANLEVTNSPTDNYILSYDTGTGGFTWIEDATGSGTPFAWDTTDYGVSTTTILGFNNGFLSNASSTINANLLINGNATSTNFAVTSLTSALISAAADGSFSEYAGTSCTNQFIRSLSALGIATCATVANTDLANSTVSYGGIQLSLGGSDATPAFALADATGLPISTGVSGLGTGIATWLGTPSIANFFSALTGEGSGVETFLTTPSSANFLSLLTDNLDLGSETSFEIPNGASPTVDALGEIAQDTTSNNIIGYDGSNSFVIGSASTTLYAANIASTTDAYIAGIVDIPSHILGQTALSLQCKVTSGTSLQVFLSDGTNDTNTVTCTTTETVYALTTNNSWTSLETTRLELGTITGSVDALVFRVYGRRTTN